MGKYFARKKGRDQTTGDNQIQEVAADKTGLGDGRGEYNLLRV